MYSGGLQASCRCTTTAQHANGTGAILMGLAPVPVWNQHAATREWGREVQADRIGEQLAACVHWLQNLYCGALPCPGGTALPGRDSPPPGPPICQGPPAAGTTHIQPLLPPTSAPSLPSSPQSHASPLLSVPAPAGWQLGAGSGNCRRAGMWRGQICGRGTTALPLLLPLDVLGRGIAQPAAGWVSGRHSPWWRAGLSQEQRGFLSSRQSSAHRPA